MATRAKARKTRAKSRGRSTTRKSAAKRATTKRATAKRATSRGRTKRASAKRTTTRSRTATSRRTTTKRKTATKRRAAPKSRATAKRRTARGRAGMALVNAAIAIREKTQSQPQPRDAIELLKQDHREVEALYKEFEQADDNSEKSKIAWKICAALTVHAEIEEQIFYPAARRAISDGDLLDEATVEHASAKQLIAEIESMTPRERLFDARVKVLGEYVKHHVREEENELFPKIRESGIDLEGLARRLGQRKLELLSEMAGRA